MGKFKFLEDVAIADAAFLAEGKTLEELFAICATATFEVMANTKKVEPKEVFKAIYIALLRKPSGPRAGWLLASLETKFLKDRFESAANL